MSEKMQRKIVSVLVECGGRKFRVIDNLRTFLGGDTVRVESDRTVSERKIGKKILDLARSLEVTGSEP
jgi:hypothetical protein